MGINGLLPVLKSIARPTHISKYKGSKAAIDGYSWLHKGAYCCSRELCEGTYTDKFVHYCLSRVELLRSHGVIPLVVLDGGRLPIKADEESGRQRNRHEARERAAAHLQAGNTNAALECYQRAVDVTPAMAKQLIEALKERNVEFMVAPYEADAQLAYLARRGDVSVVITEDSDLLAYGCPRVLYKLDRAGAGEELVLEDLVLNKGTSFVGFTQDMFLDMCILAGCDFLSNLPGIGIKKAHQQIKKYKGFVKVCKTLRFSGTPVPQDYQLRFQRAVWAFRHQRVFCPSSRTLVHLNPLPPGGIGAGDVEVPAAVPQGTEAAELAFLGPPMSNEVASGVAAGDLDPITKQPFDLQAIYRGCTRPPAHLAAQLGMGSDAAGAEGQGGAGMMRSSSAPPRIGLSRRRSGTGSGAAKPSATAQPQKGGIMRYFTKGNAGTSGGSDTAQQQQQQQQVYQQQQQQQQQMACEGADQHDPSRRQTPCFPARSSGQHAVQAPLMHAAGRQQQQQQQLHWASDPMHADGAGVQQQQQQQQQGPSAKRRRTSADEMQQQGRVQACKDDAYYQPYAATAAQAGLGGDAANPFGLHEAGVGPVPVASHQQVAARLCGYGNSSGSSGGLLADAGVQAAMPGSQQQEEQRQPQQQMPRYQQQQQAMRGFKQQRTQQEGPRNALPSWMHLMAPAQQLPGVLDANGQVPMQLDSDPSLPGSDSQPGSGLWGAAGPPAAAAAAAATAATAALGASLDGSLDTSLGASLNPSLGGSLSRGSLGGDSLAGGSRYADDLSAGTFGGSLGGGSLRSSGGAGPSGGLSQQLQEALERSSGGGSGPCGSGSSGLLSLGCTPPDEGGSPSFVGQQRSGAVSVLASLSRGPMAQGWSDGPGSTWDPCDSLGAGQDPADEEEEVVSPVKPLPPRRSTFVGLQRRSGNGAAAAAAAATGGPGRSRFFVQHQLQANAGGNERSLGEADDGVGLGRAGGSFMAQHMHTAAAMQAQEEACADSQGKDVLGGDGSQGLDSNGLQRYDCDDADGDNVADEPAPMQRVFSGSRPPALCHQQHRPLLGRRALEHAASGLLSDSEGNDAGVGAMAPSQQLSRRQLPHRQLPHRQLLGRRALDGSASGPLSDAEEAAAAAMDAAVGMSEDATAAPAAAAAAAAGCVAGGSLAVPLVRPPHTASQPAAAGHRDWPADPCGRRAGLTAVAGDDDAAAGPASGGSDGSSEPEGAGADENAFHSISHVKRYAKLAAAAVDKVARHAGVQPLQQRHQQQVQHQQHHAGTTLQPSQQQQQQQQQQRQQGRGCLTSNAARAQFKPPAINAGGSDGQQAAPTQPFGSFQRFACGRKPL